MSTTKKKISDACHEWNYSSGQCEETVPVFKVEEAPSPAYFFVSKLAVDADGDPRAYNKSDTRPPHNTSGSYDWLDNVKVSDLHGIQGQDAVGPATGFYVSGTSLTNANVPAEKDTRHWVPAATVPYIVLPNGFPNAAGEKKIRLGDCALVVDLKTRNSASAIFADTGRAVGEASIRLALDLSLNPFNPKYPPKVTGFDGKRFLYLVFPGVAVIAPWSPTDIDAKTRAAFEAWGGWDRLNLLFPALKGLLVQDKTGRLETSISDSLRLQTETSVLPDIRPVRALRIGASGTDVLRWQNFLIGQGIQIGVADGEFGDRTLSATKQFQTKHKVDPNGIVGRRTLLKATLANFPLVEEPEETEKGSNWPPRPHFPPLVSNAQRAAIFGSYQYVAAPTPSDPEQIKILGTWEDDNIIRVEVPQLDLVKGAPRGGKVRFHKLVADQLQRLFVAWESAKLLDRILTWDGSFEPRFVRGSRTVLSNHAFGSAFDINYDWNKLGQVPALVGDKGCVRELVIIANEHGFYWGGHFQNRVDGNHFEIAFLM